jgi:hypothetical protein
VIQRKALNDIHALGEVGMNFAEAIALARSVGYTQCCRFTQLSGSGSW